MAELYIPNAANWINAYEAGSEASMTRKRSKASGIAAGLMTSGDYAGAAQALAPYDPGAAMKMQDRVREDADREARAGVYSKMQSDPQGAQDDAFAMGDEDTINAVMEFREKASAQERAQAAEKSGKLSQLYMALQDVPEAQRTQMAQQYATRLQLTPEDLQGSDFSDRGLRSELALALKVDDLINFRDKEADNKRADATQEAMERDRAEDNRRAEQQLSISRGHLGLAQGREARIRAGGGGSGGGEWEEF